MKATGNFQNAQAVDPMAALTDATRANIDAWIARFPPERKRSAVIQGLIAAQDQNGGWLTDELIAAGFDFPAGPVALFVEGRYLLGLADMDPNAVTSFNARQFQVLAGVRLGL